MRVGIVGYGKVGRAVEIRAEKTSGIELVGIFTRREKSEIQTVFAPIYSLSELDTMKEEIDVLCLCLGSSRDIPIYAPELALRFNTVDSYDNHARIGEYKERMDGAARASGNISLVSFGWDPGILSLIRLISASFLPNPALNTFWGRGVSRGHSEAISRIDGVYEAVEYTVPREDALTLASLVRHPLSDTERHRRVCYVVAEKGKEDLIADEILSMENYFRGYETEIRFLSPDEYAPHRSALYHRGRIFALGSGGRFGEVKHSLIFDLEVGSNPDLTASVMLAGVAAISRIKAEGGVGAYTPFDLPLSYFAPFNCKNVNDYL